MQNESRRPEYQAALAALRRLTPDEKEEVFQREVEARSKPIRALFEMAMRAHAEQELAQAAIPPLGGTLSDLDEFNKAADHYYFDTYYAPEIYASGVVHALYDLNVMFAVEALEMTLGDAIKAAAGVEVLGRTFHEIVCALKSHMSHFHEHALVTNLDDRVLTKRFGRAAPFIRVLSDIGLTLPLDAATTFYVLNSITQGSFDVLLEMEQSVGPGLIRYALAKHGTNGGPAELK